MLRKANKKKREQTQKKNKKKIKRKKKVLHKLTQGHHLQAAGTAHIPLPLPLLPSFLPRSSPLCDVTAAILQTPVILNTPQIQSQQVGGDHAQAIDR